MNILVEGVVYRRVVDDLSVALYLPPEVVVALLGARKDLKKLKNTMLFPDVEWCSDVRVGRSNRPPRLWGALHMETAAQSSVSKAPAPSPDPVAQRRRVAKKEMTVDPDYAPGQGSRRR